MLDIGRPAPDFTLPNQQGQDITMGDLRGNYVLIYFYPQDATPGCTVQAESFRDLHESLQTEDVEVIGISTDSVESHARFADDHNLPFDILADESAQVVNLYDVNNGNDTAQRKSYLINPAGIITITYDDVDPATNAGQVLQDVKKDKK